MSDEYSPTYTNEDLKDIMQSKGIPRGLLEIKNLRAVTDLCLETTKKLKYQNLTNLSLRCCGVFNNIFHHQ
ncbi:hypothetical protein [Maribacter sp.]|uniref:hypothetical protein n=1 Tax=Maribacter sp. TaxID=1897614 RepID=UPI0025C21216|nr:hypothetical protein [Maribacter sp.]